jgi:hypothetical protein
VPWVSVEGVTRSRIDPEALLEGPRGRRVCWAMLEERLAWRLWEALESGAPMRVGRELGEAVVRSDLDAIAETPDAAAFLDALYETVSAAMYWEEPDERDRRLADPVANSALRPLAEAIASAPAAQWWATSIDYATQFEVDFEYPDGASTPPAPVDPDAALVDWHAATLAAEERAATLPDDPAAAYSGAWWSTPALIGLMRTTRALGARGPVGLSLVEDALGWSAARCQALHPRPDTSVFEIGGPDDWIELVQRYPLTVTRSRRHDWWRATGRNEPWAIPDYRAVAADYDGIHLSVLGYLSTAGRALSAGDAYTVLAGWDPDQTWWLTRSLERVGPPVRWVQEDLSGSTRWTPAAT